MKPNKTFSQVANFSVKNEWPKINKSECVYEVHTHLLDASSITANSEREKRSALLIISGVFAIVHLLTYCANSRTRHTSIYDVPHRLFSFQIFFYVDLPQSLLQSR